MKQEHTRRLEALEAKEGPDEPWEVVVRMIVVEPSESGPKPTGEVYVTRHVDGVLVEEWWEGREDPA